MEGNWPDGLNLGSFGGQRGGGAYTRNGHLGETPSYPGDYISFGILVKIIIKCFICCEIANQGDARRFASSS
jgi:hypothetical protein